MFRCKCIGRSNTDLIYTHTTATPYIVAWPDEYKPPILAVYAANTALTTYLVTVIRQTVECKNILIICKILQTDIY